MRDWKIDSTWTLFLDRDGVINERIIGGYIKTIDEFHFIDGTEKAIGYIYYIAPRKDGYLGYTYHFKKVKKRDDEMSQHGIDIPKYSKIIKIKNYVNTANIRFTQ